MRILIVWISEALRRLVLNIVNQSMGLLVPVKCCFVEVIGGILTLLASVGS